MFFITSNMFTNLNTKLFFNYVDIAKCDNINRNGTFDEL